MTELANALYEFVTSHYLPGICNDPEYTKAQDYAETKKALLNSQLNESQREILSDLLDDINLACAIRSEYIFQAALALSRELSGLVRP